MKYSLKQLAKELNISRDKLKNFLKYFNIKPLEEKPYNGKIAQYFSQETKDFLHKQNISGKNWKKIFTDKFYEENPHLKILNHEKQKQTMIEKYGVDNPSRVKEFQEKKYETFERNHNGMTQSEYMKEVGKQLHQSGKFRESVIRNFGSYESYIEHCKTKTKETIILKYGSEKNFYKWLSEKWQNTIEEKYGEGIRNPSQIPGIVEKIENKKRQNIHVDGFVLKAHIEERFNISWQALNSIVEDYKLSYTKFGNKCYLTEEEVELITPACKIVKNRSVSSREYTLREFIETLNVEYIFNNRSILEGKELDVYFPKNKIAIEFNGLYWHSFNNGGRDKFYHLNKTKNCENENIRLIHLFEDEWVYHQEKCKSIIKSALNIYDKTIYARQTVFKTVDIKEYKEFMEVNHISGAGTNPSHAFGLYYNDELVHCIGFSKSRFKKNEMELLRMATKLNTHVIGGFSKLIKNSGFNKFISYVDRRMFNGKGYLKCGFKISEYTPPSYFYVKGLNRYNRMSYQKHMLKDKLPIYDENLTEQENMLNNGYDWIYDCGTIKMYYE